MGKYSLENYEQYKAVKIRPTALSGALSQRRCGAFHTAACSLRGAVPALTDANVLLEVTDDLPCGELSAKTAALCRLGAALADAPGLMGVVLRTNEPAQRKRLLFAAACSAFRPRRLFVPITDVSSIHQLLLDGGCFGLLADVTASPYDVCEAFAAGRLQKLWQRVPVLVRAAHPIPDSFARGWHALAAEPSSAELGWRISLRRLTFPAAVTSGGYAPLRFWWANTGTSPCYEPLTAALRLRLGKDVLPLPLHDAIPRFDTADRVYNEIIRLPELPRGAWPLECALLDASGAPVLLAQAGRQPDGWYALGNMTVDELPRPELAHAWDDYYPDGYYPLEDPAQPE